ncbi:hypothetical protein ASU31_25805 [Pedobacter ginsenosidimutans]|uniref:Uncharacterized protein n=1 Tax=Pedobacter ginsenosidimutans TaxID=687842 RepID=A0A0T5VH83_9SPHI|nr:hypothetical protein ASU31_25805 [Pedobacter ginsenosidimutans]
MHYLCPTISIKTITTGQSNKNIPRSEYSLQRQFGVPIDKADWNSIFTEKARLNIFLLKLKS